MIAASLVGMLALAQVPPAEEADRLAERTEQLKFFKEKAAQIEIRPAQGAALTLVKEPVLRYSNAEREIGSLDGATFVWLSGAQPQAVISFSVRRLGNSVYRECTTLSASPLECQADGAA